MVTIITVIQNCHNNSHMNKSKNNKTSYTKATNSKYKYHCGMQHNHMTNIPALPLLLQKNKELPCLMLLSFRKHWSIDEKWVKVRYFEIDFFIQFTWYWKSHSGLSYILLYTCSGQRSHLCLVNDSYFVICEKFFVIFTVFIENFS